MIYIGIYMQYKYIPVYIYIYATKCEKNIKTNSYSNRIVKITNKYIYKII